MISIAGYAAIVLMGFWFAVIAAPVFQVVWGGFCAIRLVQIVRGGGHKRSAPEWDRESYGFALGGLISSCVVFILLAATPIRVR